jgi:hypothetical protein
MRRGFARKRKARVGGNIRISNCSAARDRESSVEEALIEMYLAAVSVRRIEGGLCSRPQGRQ